MQSVEGKCQIWDLNQQYRKLLEKVLTRLRRVVVTERFVFRNIGIEMDTLIQIFDAITKRTDGKIFVAKRLKHNDLWYLINSVLHPCNGNAAWN